MTTINELENRIKTAQDAYYNNSPIMSDIEFDMLWDELKETYPESKLLKEVGSDHTEGFSKHKHLIIMGSQNKANTAEEMNAFFRKNGNEYIASYKCDGCSCAIEYVHGKVTYITSRGDGIEGDNFTSNAMMMNGLVKDLKEDFTGTVRGEVLLDKSVKEKYFPNMKNCRNAASGIMKHLDGADCDKLTIRVYDAQYFDKSKSFNTQVNLQAWLKSKGFIVADYIFFKEPSGQDAINYINSVFENKDNIPYDIDGIVWKKNEIDMHDITTEYRPKTQIALKYKYTLATTKIIDIEWSVKNGTLTPVAVVEPCEIDGTTVQRASMCNVAMLEELGIEIGHEVTITKMGAIIPGILKNNTTGKSREGYVF